MSTNFMQAMETAISQSKNNNYGVENFDEHRFGKYNSPAKPNLSVWQKIKNLLKSADNKSHNGTHIKSDIYKFIPNPEKFVRLYSALQKKDQELLISLLAYRYLGYQKIKLQRNTNQYWGLFEQAASVENKNDTYDPHFLAFMLTKFDLNPIGKDIKLYYASMGIVATFFVEQYAYKILDKNFIEVEKNDVVFDLGACWGDTALYFADKTENEGKVYSFEFIPGNLELLNINLDLNPHLRSIIEVVEHPVSNKSNDIIYYQDHGPSSKIFLHPFEKQTGSTTTISIDDFVKKKSIEKVDFIKMDIEGAEMQALHGAVETIRKFRPKLGIAIYHSLNDMVDIPNWILDLDLGYEIFLDHFTTHAEETVCFAKPK